MTKFQPYTGASFGRSEVEIYLVELATLGWKVFTNTKPDSFVIVVDEENLIEITYQPSQKNWLVRGDKRGNPKFVEFATSFQSFKEIASNAFQQLGQSYKTGPKTLRLSQQTPASNKVGLVHLTHAATVTSIFDPYFEDKAISSLTTLVNLGLKLDSPVRVLTTSKVTARLSQQLISDFKAETGVELQIKVCNSNKEHRRFLLLSSGEALLLGCSLNSLDKNEAAHVETSPDDHTFFETQWKKSQPL